MARDDSPHEVIHRFEHAGKRYAVDVETCFCFECDAVSWDVLEYYPRTTPNRIVHLLGGTHDPVEVGEVISELEWLRATKSIVPYTKPQDVPNLFTIEQGLKHVLVILPAEDDAAQRAQRRWFARQESQAPSTKALEVGRAALALLLARSGEQKDLRFEMVLGRPSDPAPLVATLGSDALRMAALAGKRVTVGATFAVEGGFQNHGLAVRLDFTASRSMADYVRVATKSEGNVAKLAKAAQSEDDQVRGCAVLRPTSPTFVGAVRALHDAGFQEIELDLESVYTANASVRPDEVQHGLAETATYYAERLLKNDYFRLEPIASLFARIYHGMPTRRSDPAGVQTLAVDADGGIWPNAHFIGCDDAHLGNVLAGEWDEAFAARFADVGVTATSACMRCWARHLCGGGAASVHQALTGSFRTPHEAWCDAQREWMAAAVSAFNLLSSQGVHFTRIYQSLNRRGRPSLFQLARTALKMSVIVRPLGEADAPMLRAWENWNTASYFLLKQNGTLLTTKYDREMDALYPHGDVQEMLLTTRRGEALGLVRMQPDRWPGIHRAWLYLHRESDYAAASVRNGFREILTQIAPTQDIRRVTFCAADFEHPLRDFYGACGFRHEGTLREALYLTRHYHDIHVYSATIAEL